MAEDTREAHATAAPPTSTATPPPRKTPKGIVLGPDGKPCRTCNTLSDFTSQRRTLSSLPSISSAPSSSHTYTASPPSDPTNCPPDITLLGRSSWTLLHSLSAAYPVSPTALDKSNMRTFMSLFATLYPCWTCRDDFREYMAREQVRVGSRDEFGRWMCEAHNEVNRKTGKEVFDCARWEERWGRGWGDGSCD